MPGTSPSDCFICGRVRASGFTLENAHAVAFPDGFPVSEGHTLIVPRRHEASLFDLNVDEFAAVWSLVSSVQRALSAA